MFGGWIPFSAALLEAVAVAVHFQDVNVVSEPIKQSAGQPLRAEDLSPFIKGQVAGHQGGRTFVALAEGLEEQLGAGLGQGHVAQFIDDE